MTDLLLLASAIFQVPVKDIVRHTKTRRVSQARQAVCYAARRRTAYSFQEIGDLLGGREHTTIMNAVQAAEDRARADPAYALDLVGLL